jgi:hypothetical protein
MKLWVKKLTGMNGMGRVKSSKNSAHTGIPVNLCGELLKTPVS